MNLIFTVIGLLILVFVTVPVFAKTITVTGYGSNLNKAETDALRNAVEQAAAVVVDSKTLVKNGRLIEDKILAQSRGYINSYSVVEKTRTSDGWKVSVNADVDINPNSKLMDDLVREGIINLTLRNPKIAVVISDEISRGGRTPAEIGITDAFIQAGFSQIINVDQLGISKSKISTYGEEQLKELAARLNADVIVVGRVSVSRAGDVGKFIDSSRTGMISYRAQIDARMYMSQSKRIVAVGTKVGSGIDIAETVAAKSASSKAGKLLGEEFVDKLISQGAGQKQMIEIIVFANDFSKVNMLKSVLEQIEAVKMIELSAYRDGQGVFSVKYSGSTAHLFEMIDKKADFFVEMISADYSTLKLKTM